MLNNAVLLERAHCSHALLDLGSPGVKASSSSRAEERNRTPDRCDQPEQHIRQIHPYRIPHSPNAALLRTRVLADVHITEEAE